MRSLAHAALALLVPLAACGNGADDRDSGGVAPSGGGTSRSYPVADFTAVEAAGPDDVAVRVGPAFSVRAEGPSEVLDRLRIERTGDALRIARRPQTGLTRTKGSARVTVTMPAIAAASLAGSGDLSVDRAGGERFRGSIAGSGALTVAALRVRELEVSIAGSGSVGAAGEAETLKVRIAGSGDVKAPGLRTRGADVSIAGSGSVAASVDGAATVRIMGSGDVDLGPRARCTTKKAGSGTVRCGA